MSDRLTAEEAAKLANLPLPAFRQRMTRLNDTDQDLRAPRQPGERARSYDAKKVTEWIANGMPSAQTPKNAPSPPAKDATLYAGHASRSGRHISATFAEIDLKVSGRTVGEVEALAQQEIAERFNTSPEKIQVALKFDLPPTAQKHLDQLTEAREQFGQLQARIAQLQHDTARELYADGWQLSSIADVLGVSASRVYQILNNR